MNTITVAHLQTYFENERPDLDYYDFTKLLSGDYSAFRTQLAFAQYKRGFNLCNNLYAGDAK